MTASQKPPATRLSRTARREQLLNAARAIFAHQGFHAASMDEIADSAGISKPVLYRHFPSKLALYQALLDSSALSMISLVEQAIQSTNDNNLRVQRAVAAYFDFVADENQAFRLIFESDLRDEPEVAAVVNNATQECIAAITDTIAADTALIPSKARLLAAGLVGLSQVGARYWLDQDNQMSKTEAVELLTGLAWRGIAHFPRHLENLAES